MHLHELEVRMSKTLSVFQAEKKVNFSFNIRITQTFIRGDAFSGHGSQRSFVGQNCIFELKKATSEQINVDSSQRIKATEDLDT